MRFFNKVGIHWHLWRIRRRQRMYYDAGVSLGNLDPGRNKNTIDPDCLSHFPTRVIGQVRPVVEESPEDVSVVDQATRPRRPMSILSIRTERALENAEALAATIVHPRKPVVSSSTTTTTTATDSHSVQGDDTTSVASDVPASPPAQPTPVPPQELQNPQNQQNQQQEEACVICLDDFVHGEVVRKLPCGHEYHCECIDPWLTIKSASCPLCKHDCSIHVLVPEEGDQPLRPEAALTTMAHDNRSQSGFSLSFLRRRMDAENQQRGGATPTSTVSSSFGPTLSVEEAEAFSRSWMARSLPRNMRRQIRQAVQEAHLAQQMHDDEPTVPLPARMTQQSHHETPETTTIAIDVPAAAPTSSSPATFSSHRLFRSLPTQWRS
ncbi:hypothetical protein BC940DRAFT_293573 [Gongronella butleri]|nr:hypothetical protein BC940DRAFT_293573 [Gongronella butleri]